MTALDGNAVAGLLYDLFGQEMTGTGATCAHCGRRSILAGVKVFRGPGTVLLCPGCDGCMMVIVQRDAISCVDAEGLTGLTVRLPQPVTVRSISDQPRPS